MWGIFCSAPQRRSSRVRSPSRLWRRERILHRLPIDSSSIAIGRGNARLLCRKFFVASRTGVFATVRAVPSPNPPTSRWVGRPLLASVPETSQRRKPADRGRRAARRGSGHQRSPAIAPPVEIGLFSPNRVPYNPVQRPRAGALSGRMVRATIPPSQDVGRRR